MVGFLDEGLLVSLKHLFVNIYNVSVVGFLDEGLLGSKHYFFIWSKFVSVVGFLDEGLLGRVYNRVYLLPKGFSGWIFR